MEIQQLEAFRAVVYSGGFAKAATRLGLSQPTVSYRIAKLEEGLGVPLFEEPRRRLVLTDAGRRLDEYCSRALPEIESIRSELVEGGVGGPMRVVCAGAFGRSVVFPALADPGLRGRRVRLRFRSLEEIFDLVEAGEADIGIAYSTRVRSRLDFRLLTHEEFCLVVPVNSPIGAETSLQEIVGHDFVTYEECDFVFGRWFQDVFGSAPPRFSPSFSFSRIEEVVESVALGRGVSIVPVHSLGRNAAEERVRIVRPADRTLCLNPEYAVTRPGWRDRPDVSQLLRAIRKEAGHFLPDAAIAGPEGGFSPSRAPR